MIFEIDSNFPNLLSKFNLRIHAYTIISKLPQAENLFIRPRSLTVSVLHANIFKNNNAERTSERLNTGYCDYWNENYSKMDVTFANRCIIVSNLFRFQVKHIYILGFRTEFWILMKKIGTRTQTTFSLCVSVCLASVFGLRGRIVLVWPICKLYSQNSIDLISLSLFHCLYLFVALFNSIWLFRNHNMDFKFHQICSGIPNIDVIIK